MSAAKHSRGGGCLLLLALAVLAAAALKNHLSATGDRGVAPGGYVKPADGPVTSGYGARWGATHYGLDIAAPRGAPIRAVAAGRVVEAGRASGFGNWVRLQHPGGDITVYGHMATYQVATGQHVATGERIAAVGSAGQATGPHLHFEIWPHGQRGHRVDPKPWLAARGIHL